MKRLLPLMLVLAGLAFSQIDRDALLPTPRTVTGVVVDSAGMPVADARIDHSEGGYGAFVTDTQGHFALQTKSPILIVRKEGYRSHVIRSQEATFVRVTLDAVEKPRTLPVCSSEQRCSSIKGSRGMFCLPKVNGVKSGRQGHDVDYAVRNYFVEGKRGSKGVMHGTGAYWSYGIPSNRDVWPSVHYSEETFTYNGISIIDARGQTATGERWRFLGKFGESASYGGVDEGMAQLLDRVLDGVCVLPEERR